MGARLNAKNETNLTMFLLAQVLAAIFYLLMPKSEKMQLNVPIGSARIVTAEEKTGLNFILNSD